MMAPNPFRSLSEAFSVVRLDADIDLSVIALATAAADPAGHCSRPDVTRLLLHKTPGNRVTTKWNVSEEMQRSGENAPTVASSRTKVLSGKSEQAADVT